MSQDSKNAAVSQLKQNEPTRSDWPEYFKAHISAAVGDVKVDATNEVSRLTAMAAVQQGVWKLIDDWEARTGSKPTLQDMVIFKNVMEEMAHLKPSEGWQSMLDPGFKKCHGEFRSWKKRVTFISTGIFRRRKLQSGDRTDYVWEVLFVKNRTPYKKKNTKIQHHYWTWPGGKVEFKDRDLRQTAIRELKEETGIELTEEEFKPYPEGEDGCLVGILQDERSYCFAIWLPAEDQRLKEIKLNKKELLAFGWRRLDIGLGGTTEPHREPTEGEIALNGFPLKDPDKGSDSDKQVMYLHSDSFKPGNKKRLSTVDQMLALAREDFKYARILDQPEKMDAVKVDIEAILAKTPKEQWKDVKP